MNNRRKFLAAGGTLAVLSGLPKASADQPSTHTIYLHGMVWNRQLIAPMNDWLIRLDANAEIPNGLDAPAIPGFATLGDDLHDGVSSHLQFQTATLQGDQLAITGVIAESKTAALVGQTVRIDGKVIGTAVQRLTVTIGGFSLSGAGILTLKFSPEFTRLPPSTASMPNLRD